MIITLVTYIFMRQGFVSFVPIVVTPGVFVKQATDDESGSEESHSDMEVVENK